MVGFITLGIALVIAALVALYFKFDIVRKIVDTVFDAMLAGGKAVFNGLTTYFTAIFNIYKSLFNGSANLRAGAKTACDVDRVVAHSTTASR